MAFELLVSPMGEDRVQVRTGTEQAELVGVLVGQPAVQVELGAVQTVSLAVIRIALSSPSRHRCGGWG